MASKIIRVTMIKATSDENQAKIIELYRVVAANAVKDGKPYILSVDVGPAHEDQRSQGYNVVSKTEFRNLEDMNYYDWECEAHKAFKRDGKGLADGVLIIYYTPTVTAVI